MALGGGTFLVQNKVLPGAYINFVSVPYASATLSDRGYATIPLPMSWGPEGKIFTVELADFIKDSQKIFGHAYTAQELLPMREIFKHAKTVHFFRLNMGGKKASCALCSAKYPGVRGNDVRVVVEASEETTEEKPLFDVSTYLGNVPVDRQDKITAMADLKDNDFVVWDDKAELSLFCARMRDDVGKKFQVVASNHLADYEGVVSVKNGLEDVEGESAALVPWVTGVVAGTAVNKSATNMVYDGEYAIDTDYSQTELENGIREGSFLFHKVDGKARVLTDINSFISITDEKSPDFSSNQTIRVLDQIANDIAVLFGDKYIGKVPNDASGRISLWNDIVKHHQQLESIRAIENFSPEDVVVEKGDTKKSVVVTDRVSPINAMEQLYMTVWVE